MSQGGLTTKHNSAKYAAPVLTVSSGKVQAHPGTPDVTALGLSHLPLGSLNHTHPLPHQANVSLHVPRRTS